MVLPSAGVALEQVTTLWQGHDCLRFVPSVSLARQNKNSQGQNNKAFTAFVFQKYVDTL
jgi:hypothetical protein